MHSSVQKVQLSWLAPNPLKFEKKLKSKVSEQMHVANWEVVTDPMAKVAAIPKTIDVQVGKHNPDVRLYCLDTSPPAKPSQSKFESHKHDLMSAHETLAYDPL